jgi:hypothetical protein
VNHWTRIGLLAAALTGAQIFLFGPVEIWARNAADLSIRWPYLLAGGLAASFAVFMPLAVVVMLTPRRWRAVPACVLAAVAVLAWIYASFLFRESLEMDGRDRVMDLTSPLGAYEWLVLAVAVAILAFIVARVPRPAVVMLAALLVANAGVTAARLTTEQGTAITSRKTSPEPMWRFARDGNVLAILLDALQSDVAADEIQRDPALAAAFEGFTFFKNTTGVAPTTFPTMPTIHSGHLWDPNESLVDQYKRRIEQESFLKRLQAAGYETVLVPPIRNVCPEDISLCVGTDIMRGSDAACPPGATPCRIVARVAGRTSAQFVPQLLNLFDMSAMRTAPFAIKGQIYNGGSWWFSRGTTAAYSMEFIARSREMLYALATKLIVDDGPPTAKLLHLASTHQPYVFDAECKPQLPALAGSIEVAARCSLRGVAAILARLKSEGAYDGSTVLIFADHGADRPSSYRTQSRSDNLAWTFMASRANPVLMVKAPGARGALTYDMRPVSIADIPATICTLTQRCKAEAGRSVFSTEPRSEPRTFFWYDWRAEYWNLKSVPGVRKFALTGPPWDEASWSLTGPAAGYALGTPLRFEASGNSAEYLGLGWAHAEDWGRWTDGERAVLRITPAWDRTTDLVLTLKARGFVTTNVPRQDVDLVVNGAPAGRLSFESFDIVERSIRLRAATVPEGETLELAFLTKDARSPFSVGLSSDTRRLGIGVVSMALATAPVETQRAPPSTVKAAIPMSGLDIDFRQGGNAMQYAATGWAQSEDWGTWTDGSRAILRLKPASVGTSDLVLTVRARGFVVPQHPQQDIDVLLNGTAVGRWSFNSFEIVERELRLPASLVAGSDMLELTFVAPSARSPAELGLSADTRRLGIGVASATLRQP